MALTPHVYQKSHSISIRISQFRCALTEALEFLPVESTDKRQLGLAAGLTRRAGRLNAVVPKLRAKGAEEAVEMFLTQDAVAPSGPVRTKASKTARRIFLYARRGSKRQDLHESVIVRLMRSTVATPTLKCRAMARMDWPSLSMVRT